MQYDMVIGNASPCSDFWLTDLCGRVFHAMRDAGLFSHLPVWDFTAHQDIFSVGEHLGNSYFELLRIVLQWPSLYIFVHTFRSFSEYFDITLLVLVSVFRSFVCICKGGERVGERDRDRQRIYVRDQIQDLIHFRWTFFHWAVLSLSIWIYF